MLFYDPSWKGTNLEKKTLYKASSLRIDSTIFSLLYSSVPRCIYRREAFVHLYVKSGDRGQSNYVYKTLFTLEIRLIFSLQGRATKMALEYTLA